MLLWPRFRTAQVYIYTYMYELCVPKIFTALIPLIFSSYWLSYFTLYQNIHIIFNLKPTSNISLLPSSLKLSSWLTNPWDFAMGVVTFLLPFSGILNSKYFGYELNNLSLDYRIQIHGTWMIRYKLHHTVEDRSGHYFHFKAFIFTHGAFIVIINEVFFF